MPILHGDRIVGRLDPNFDRTANVLRIDAVYAEPDAPASAWPAIRKQIDELGAWLGAGGVSLPDCRPSGGKRGREALPGFLELAAERSLDILLEGSDRRRRSRSLEITITYMSSVPGSPASFSLIWYSY